ncbi:pyocin knob domain-containing protein [Pseudomonas sp. F16(2018)]|uniref:pyocin knob domain-containing protein n=1 Tax=Pseudomonas sp. F16(2018) TaxID=2093746 RepID=UPI00111846AA|nr:pyocin knob domain-containing protein [Pseudomonas sp. F16(2018)]
MAQKTIELGTAPDGMDGDDARTAFQKTNDNFTELYQGVGGAQPASPKLSAIAASVWAANQLLIATGENTVGALATGVTGRTLVAANNAAEGRGAIAAQALHANLTGLSSVASGVDRLPIFSDNAGAMTFLQVGAAGKQLNTAVTWDNVRTLIEYTRPLALSTKESGSFDDFTGMGWADQLLNGGLTNSPSFILPGSQRPAYWYLHNTYYPNTATGSLIQVAYPYSVGAVDKGSICWRHRYSGVWGTWQRALTQADVTTSPTDSTTGRLLKTGDFGVGGMAPTLGAADLNSVVTVTGIYYVSAPTNGPTGFSGYGFLQVMRLGGTISQTLTSYSDGKTYKRARPDDGQAWSAWQNMTPVGVGQNWGANLAGSRSYDTTYTNNSGRTMFVQVFAGATSAVQVGLQITSGSVSVIGAYSATAGGYVSVGPVPIAPGATYVVAQRNGTAAINSWAEFT